MKLCMRTLAGICLMLALAISGLVYVAGDRLQTSGLASKAALSASLDAYRHAQALKAHAASYELTMNEFYSTVLEYPSYQKKFSEQKAAIDRELSMLGSSEDSAPAVKALSRIYREMDTFRMALESALTASDKDWDGAREALYKLNVLSVQAIAQADLLAQLSQDRAKRLEQRWQTELSQTTSMLYLTTVIAGLIAITLIIGIIFERRGRAVAGTQTA